MSAEQVQEALIELVYLPDFNRGEDLESFVGRFDLDEDEKWQVRSIAQNPFVRKFGKEQQQKRFNFNVRKFLPVSFLLMGKSRAGERLFCEFFEKSPLSHVDETETASAYVAFAKAQPQLLNELNLPDFIVEVMDYELKESALGRHDVAFGWKTPEGSLLNDGAPFFLLKLNYDVPELCRKAIDLGEDRESIAQLKAKPKRHILLLVKTEDPDSPGSFLQQEFEVEEEVHSFLSEQLKERSDHAKIPSCYSELVSLGLCKDL